MDIKATFIHQQFVADNYDVSKYQSVVGHVQNLCGNIVTIVFKHLIEKDFLHLVFYSHQQAATDPEIDPLRYFGPVRYTEYPCIITRVLKPNNNRRIAAWLIYSGNFDLYTLVLTYITSTLIMILGEDILQF